jgi:hypothetical protein
MWERGDAWWKVWRIGRRAAAPNVRMSDMGETSPKRIVAGGLLALFVALVVAALTVFGINSMALGHVFMLLAFLVGALLIWTEIIPSRPPKHKLIATLVLFAIMGLGDGEIIRYKKREALIPQSAKSKPPMTTRSAATNATSIVPSASIPNADAHSRGPSPTMSSVSPELPTLGFQDNSDVVEASFGTLTGGNHIALLKGMKGRPVYPLDYNGVTPVSFRYVNGQVSYSVKFWSPAQQSVIEVKDGKFTVRNDSLDRNYS